MPFVRGLRRQWIHGRRRVVRGGGHAGPEQLRERRTREPNAALFEEPASREMAAMLVKKIEGIHQVEKLRAES